MSGHTSEPWQVNDQTASGAMNNSVYICDEAGRIIARVFNDYGNHVENARRIVACVNACEGISTDALERNKVILSAKSYGEMVAQRDNLLDGLKRAERETGFINCQDLSALIAEVEASK